MKKFLSFAVTAMAILALGSLTSCHDSEVENIQQTAFQHSYENGFVKTFGKVSPNQTWDFTSYARHQRMINQNLTRDMTEYQTVAYPGEDWYYVEDGTREWLNTNLPEGKDHTGIVNSSVFRTEDKETVFEIVPIYQGTAQLVWDLYFSYRQDGEAEDVHHNVRLWGKSENLECSHNEEGLHDDIYWYPKETTSQGGRTDSTTIKHIRAQPIQITVGPYTTMHFYLKITGDNGTTTGTNPSFGKYGEIGDSLSSDDVPTQIGVIPCPLPSNIRSIDQGYSSYILGCEDCRLSNTNSDKDYNDVVFILTGYAPEVIYNEEPRTTYIKKRYMIEDLGDTFDYDFNDIVVDVTQASTQTWVINTEDHTAEPKKDANGNVIPPVIEQSATVQLLCGTLPIQIQVGDTYFGQVTDPTAGTTAVTNQLNRENPDTNYGGPTCPEGTAANRITPGVTKTVTGWNPDTNNVTAYVWKLEDASVEPSASSTGIWTSTFPGTGAIPYIIAVDQDVEPMPERTHIPDDWMATGE